MTTHAHDSLGSPPLTRSAFLPLPALREFSVEFRACSAQRLPPLWTTALHGAIERALLDLGCDCRGERETGARPRVHLDGCPYVLLSQAPAREGDAPGVEDRAPSPLVVAPSHFDPSRASLELREGESVALRLVVVGSAAPRYTSLLQAALQRVARGGLGIDPARPDGVRPALELNRFAPTTPPALAPCDTARFESVTPLRLVFKGKVRASLDATTLWSAMLRRGDILSRRYGAGALACIGTDAPFSVEVQRSRVVDVRRWSGRQRQRLSWPGVSCSMTLHGAGLVEAWPLLEFLRSAQVGKGTSFGFGRFDLSVAGTVPDGTATEQE